MNIDQLRELLNSHQPIDPYVLFKEILGLIAVRDLQIEQLLNAVERCEQRCEQRDAKMQAQIDRLKGIHGA